MVVSRRSIFSVCLACIIAMLIWLFTLSPKTNPHYQRLDRLSIATMRTTVEPKWNGDCPLPMLNASMRAASWYPLYRSHLEKVSLRDVSVSNVHYCSHGVTDKDWACARWWHATPASKPEELDRLKVWTADLKPNYSRPACDFGQTAMPSSACGEKMRELWSALDDLGVVYYPLGGTELGIVKKSSLLKADGDIDLFVDMPEVKLHEVLKGRISLSLIRDDDYHPNDYQFAVWYVGDGCWKVNFFFVDWQPFHSLHDLQKRASHADTCTCFIDSVPLSCHRDSRKRMQVYFGPSWRVPLGVKYMETPALMIRYRKGGWTGWSDAVIKQLQAKLKSMRSSNGLIEETAVRAQDNTVEFADGEMDMILAQLNVLLAGLLQ